MKYLLKQFTVQMPAKMANQIKAEFMKELSGMGEVPYMLALQPKAATGECKVAIISQKLGLELQKVINKHKRNSK